MGELLEQMCEGSRPPHAHRTLELAGQSRKVKPSSRVPQGSITA